MSSLWEQRAARNEALFREVNENIARLEERFGTSAGESVFICECSNEQCTEHVPVDGSTYRKIREYPRRFLVLPGHVDDTVESVIEERPGYLIVEKTGAAGDIAEHAS
ncbi:MAG: hypothetical protein QOG85_1384 [Gaiellaceae bacterium]|jgi:hypothetical protein|nr:hypothetical protein [Gaiellaceae bacterium]